MSDTNFYPLAANGADYPSSAVSLLPQPTCSAWLDRSGASERSAFLSGGESFTHSRYALAETLRRAGVVPGRTVLLPSFHCRAMVEPVLYLGAKPLFYPLMPDLSPDFAALPALLDTRVAAMLVTHFFGFPSAIEASERLCAAHGIHLIEDCAHALYGQAGDRDLGTIGSYAVASLWKFLPIRDGSVLRDNTQQPSERQRQTRPMMAELKACAGLVETGIRSKRERLLSPSAAKLAAAAQRIAVRGSTASAEPGLKEFSPAAAAWPAFASSRYLGVAVAHGRVAQKRRQHYQRWLIGMQGVPGVRPLNPELPEHVVPYAFPLLIDTEGLLFHYLKLAGMPIWRWEDMALTACPVARDYRLRLLQLPCHQELSEQELAWMIQTVQTLAREVFA